MRQVATGLALLPLLAFALTLRAGDGNIPISGVPCTISVPGHYYLTKDLTLAAGIAITISSSQVTLDLNGHSLTVTGTTGSNTPIYANGAPGYTAIRITNGTVIGGGQGIFLGGSTGGNYQVDHLDVSGAGAGFAEVQIFANAGASPAAHAVVESVRVVGCAGAGIYLDNVAGGRITDSSVRGCGDGITLSNTRGVRVEGNTVQGNTSRGIYVAPNGANLSTGNAIVNNVVQQNGGRGLWLNTAHDNRVNRNTVSQNGTGGIWVVGSNGNDFSGNTVTGNTGNGFELASASRNSFDWNVASVNTNAGLNITDAGSTGNIYSFNRFAGNTSANVYGAGNISAGGNSAGGANF